MIETPIVGWCSNVLSAQSVGTLIAQLDAVAPALPRSTPVGLWLPHGMLDEDLSPLSARLDAHDFPVLGLNAFPVGAFHAPVVKDAVYLPHWADPERLDYTVRAAQALAELLPPGSRRGLTTLPVGWPAHDVDLDVAALQLRQACTRLEEIGDRTGTHLHLAVEPEPGCILSTAGDLATFVEEHGLRDLAASGVLRACLDACHLAVMHESPSEAVARLSEADVSIGRLQLSSAPESPGDSADLATLLALDEPRWMHQTSVMLDGSPQLWNDLPDAAEHAPRSGIWRTHLHIPVHLEHLGPLGTTRDTITSLLLATQNLPDPPVVEVETYAWSALPPTYRRETLGEDIAEELRWVRGAMDEARW